MIFPADDELLERARRRARERGVSLAQLIREALERDLRGPSGPPLGSIGVADGPGDLAERADALYEPDQWRS